MIIRRANAFEFETVRDVVQKVVDETYGGIWAQPPLQIDDEDWSLAWVADTGASFAGIALTHLDWVGDLWVLKPYRCQGTGAALLQRAEAEIHDRGYSLARLRTVSLNVKAVSFYAKRGWAEQTEYAHEILPVKMTEMSKSLTPRSI